MLKLDFRIKKKIKAKKNTRIRVEALGDPKKERQYKGEGIETSSVRRRRERRRPGVPDHPWTTGG